MLLLFAVGVRTPAVSGHELELRSCGLGSRPAQESQRGHRASPGSSLVPRAPKSEVCPVAEQVCNSHTVSEQRQRAHRPANCPPSCRGSAQHSTVQVGEE